jgi:hypothetical protein
LQDNFYVFVIFGMWQWKGKQKKAN